jgi:hypothetical protein
VVRTTTPVALVQMQSICTSLDWREPPKGSRSARELRRPPDAASWWSPASRAVLATARVALKQLRRFVAATLGEPTFSYLPCTVFNIPRPLIAVAMAFAGRRMLTTPCQHPECRQLSNPALRALDGSHHRFTARLLGLA